MVEEKTGATAVPDAVSDSGEGKPPRLRGSLIKDDVE
jgi:hypothetical protein